MGVGVLLPPGQPSPSHCLTAHSCNRPSSICLLAQLLVGHFLAMVGTVLTTKGLPVMLLDSWGLLALLAVLLSATLLGCSCLVWGESAQIYNLRSASPLLACQGPFASSR